MKRFKNNLRMKVMKIAATIKDVAKLSGLSVGTVSRYLNGFKLKEANEEKISKAIEELNFVVNANARFLKTNKSEVIGVIIPSIQLTFASEIVNVLEKVFSEHGYSMMITIIPDSSEKSSDKLMKLMMYQPEGLIVVPPAENKGLTDWLKEVTENIPTIVIDRILPGFTKTHYVIVNNEPSARKAVRHFIQKGHQKIGLITGDKEGYTTVKRTEGYINELIEHKISYKKIAYSDNTEPGGYESTARLMNSKDQPTAIFTTNYDMTLGALRYFKDHQLAVGEDISIIGFDLDEINNVYPKEISLVLQPIHDMAEYAAKKLIESLVSNIQLSGKNIFDCTYIKGETVVQKNNLLDNN